MLQLRLDGQFEGTSILHIAPWANDTNQGVGVRIIVLKRKCSNVVTQACIS